MVRLCPRVGMEWPGKKKWFFNTSSFNKFDPFYTLVLAKDEYRKILESYCE